MRNKAKHILFDKAFGNGAYNEVSENEFGKPFFKDQMIFFNISHSERCSVIGVSDHNLGVDIEKIPDDTKHEKDSWRNNICSCFFPNDYQLLYENADESSKITIFTQLWTQIEAVLKAEGCGFSNNPKHSPELFKNWKLKNIYIDDYIITIAMHEDFSYTVDYI
jgi:4'-phosphopantetheinyl transferase